MNNQPAWSRRKLVLISILLMVFLIGIGALIDRQHRNSPSYTQKIVDKDTGEVAYIQPNKEAETQAGGGGIIIFGSSVVFNNGATQDQYIVLRKLLNSYSSGYLGSKYSSITIVPKSTHSNAGDIKSQLRLGEGSTKLNIEIKLTNLYYVQLTIVDPAGHYSRYDSGVQPQNVQG